MSIPAEEVARLIHNSIMMDKPKTRQVIVAKKWMIELMMKLPDRVVDKMMLNQMKGVLEK